MKSKDDIMIIKFLVLCLFLVIFNIGLIFYYDGRIKDVMKESLFLGTGIGYKNGQIDALKGKWSYRAVSKTDYEEIPGIPTSQPAK